jgi:hypothetical protein
MAPFWWCAGRRHDDSVIKPEAVLANYGSRTIPSERTALTAARTACEENRKSFAELNSES